MRGHRRTLISLVQELIDEESVDKDFAEDWENLFGHRLFEWQAPDDALARIDEAIERVS